jgi:hypothetical protein
LFIPQVTYEYGEPRWNDIDREKPKKSDKNLTQCHFFQIPHGLICAKVQASKAGDEPPEPWHSLMIDLLDVEFKL